MKVFYKDILEDELPISYSTSFIEEDGSYDDIIFSGALSKVEGIYRLYGVLKFNFNSRCDRCLEAVKLDINERIEQLISPTERYAEQQSEAGLTDDEADTYVTGSEYFDIAEYLHEEAILLTPFKRLCKDECQGICDRCGVNLNIEPCACKNKVADIRWSKLSEIE